MKIFLGGAFDPVHKAHIQLAITVSKKLGSAVTFLPLGGTPSYKQAPQANKNERLAMLNLIVKKYPKNIKIDYSESDKEKYSPTFETLNKIRRNSEPAEPIYFIIGADSLYSLDSWDNYEQLFKLTNFIVINRPGYTSDQASPQLIAQINARCQPNFAKIVSHGQIIFIDFTPMPISSTEIRKKCAANTTIDQLVEPEIANYIYTHNLYCS